MYVVNGTQNDWQQHSIDLSWWAGLANVPIRFHIDRWNNETADGWYIDDVSVSEQTPIPVSYPFFDGFDQGLGNWIPSTWHLVSDYQNDGAYSVYNRVADDNNITYEQPMLSMAGWMDLTNAVDPQLIFLVARQY